jgi:hypothetical protein
MAKVAMKGGKMEGQCCQGQQDDVAKLAYKFFIDRGGKHGYHQEDWLKAEAIVKGKKK